MSRTTEMYCRVPTNWMSDFSLCLFEWQTLVGGILAIFAALLGSLLLYRQINQADVLERRRAERRFAAIRATLPLVLKEICEFAKRMLDELVRARGTRPDISVGPVSENYDPPEIALHLVGSLQEIIEATDRQWIVNWICEIIREIQILSSRSRSLQDANDMMYNSSVPSNIDEYIVQAARLHVLTSSLYPFARGEADEHPDPISWDAVSSYLFFRHIEREEFPGVYSVIQSRDAAWTSLWPKRKREEQG